MLATWWHRIASRDLADAITMVYVIGWFWAIRVPAVYRWVTRWFDVEDNLRGLWREMRSRKTPSARPSTASLKSRSQRSGEPSPLNPA